MKKTDPYETLEVGKNATTDEIRRAYRKGSKSRHPDAGGTEDGFKRFGEAYRLLSDPARRERFDRTGDEREVQDVRTKAETKLAAMFIQAIEGLMKRGSHETTDVVALVRRNLREAVAELTVQANEHRTAAGRFRTAAGRSGRKGQKVNLVRAMLEQRSKEEEACAQERDDKRELAEEMLRLTDEYAWRFEKPKDAGFTNLSGAGALKAMWGSMEGMA